MPHTPNISRQPIRWLAVIFTLLAFGSVVIGVPVHAETIRFGTPQWPGATVKTEVAAQLLEKIGYQTKTVNASTAAILNSIANKRLDVDMAVWRPSQNGLIDPVIQRGEAVQLTANIRNARYQNAVPAYVWKAGVHSLADLDKYADRFGHKIYGIESGNVGNMIDRKAIENGTYHLSGWQVVPSSTSGMLSQVAHAVSRKDWIVFLGWEPHWMNIKFDMKYLRDPKGIWGKKSMIYTVVHPDFRAEHANVTRFLSQMIVPKRAQSHWILEYGYKDRPAAKVARNWIAHNSDIIARWLDGVTTADNDRPAAALFAGHVQGH